MSRLKESGSIEENAPKHVQNVLEVLRALSDRNDAE
jgi:hypothetical protein